MTLKQHEIEKIADILFQKLIKNQESHEKLHNQFIVNDEFGNSRNVSELEYYSFELHKLEKLENKYAEREEYEKAAVIKNKIRHIKDKIKKL